MSLGPHLSVSHHITIIASFYDPTSTSLMSWLLHWGRSIAEFLCHASWAWSWASNMNLVKGSYSYEALSLKLFTLKSVLSLLQCHCEVNSKGASVVAVQRRGNKRDSCILFV